MATGLYRARGTLNDFIQARRQPNHDAASPPAQQPCRPRHPRRQHHKQGPRLAPGTARRRKSSKRNRKANSTTRARRLHSGATSVYTATAGIRACAASTFRRIETASKLGRSGGRRRMEASFGKQAREGAADTMI